MNVGFFYKDKWLVIELQYIFQMCLSLTVLCLWYVQTIKSVKNAYENKTLTDFVYRAI